MSAFPDSELRTKNLIRPQNVSPAMFKPFSAARNLLINTEKADKLIEASRN